jgi:YegS/Rv2252/BmrU family lipid kinase
MKLAVVAHAGKSLDGGLAALRGELARRGHGEPAWYEVPRSKKVPAAVARALADQPDLLLVWGGDGTVQRAVDAIVRHKASAVALGVLPAGTANLFAANLGIPIALEGALEVALGGARRKLDVGVLNGERFAVMAGIGFDALMIRDASGGLKDRFGRLAYVWTGAKNVRRAAATMSVDIDGTRWFDGTASSVVIGNVGTLIGGIELFADADPSDGQLNVAVVHAEKLTDWARLAGRALTHHVDRSPLVTTTTGRKIDVRLDRKLPYELDGGDRPKTKRLKARVRPGAITVCVPATPGGES